MKKLFFFISFAILFFNSCQKETVFEMSANKESDNIQTIEVKVVNGVLTFTDGNAFSKMSEVLSNMNETELFEWEKSIGFKSYKRAFTEFNDKLNETKTEEEFNRILDENKSLYKMNGDMIESRFPVEFYATLVNTDGCYAINTNKYVVDDKNIYIENEKKEFISYIISTQNDVKAPVNAEVIKECNKRRVIGNTTLYLVVWNGVDPFTRAPTQLQQLKYEVKSRGYKKYLGNWHLYRTDHSFEKIILNTRVPYEINYDIPFVSINSKHKYSCGYSDYENYYGTTHYNLQTATINIPMGDVVYKGNSMLGNANFSLMEFRIDTIRNRAHFKTTGTGACGWATIDYW